MFKKLQRQLDRKREGRQPIKFRFDVKVLSVVGIPKALQQCRIVWSRGAKVQITPLAEAKDGILHFDKLLSQIATIYRDTHGNVEPKQYDFKIQTPTTMADGRMVTVGRGRADMAFYAKLDCSAMNASVPIEFVFGGRSMGTGEIRLEINSQMIRGVAGEDGITVVSELTGISSALDSTDEQDLEGFNTFSVPSRQSSIDKTSFDQYDAPARLQAALEPKVRRETPEGDVPRGAGVNELRALVAELEAQVEEQKRDRAVLEGRMEEVAASSRRQIAELRQQLDQEKKDKCDLEGKLKDAALERSVVEKQLKDAATKLKTDLATISRQLDTERAEKQELETQLVHHLEAAGEEAIEEAVNSALASREIRYNKLREEYEEILERAQNEIDELNQQILAAQEKVIDLGKRLDCSEEARQSLAREKKALEASLMETSGDRLDLEQRRKKLELEVEEIRRSHASSLRDQDKPSSDARLFMDELVKTKVELAELSEKHIILRRDLYKAREANMLLASKMTKFETVVYDQRSRVH